MVTRPGRPGRRGRCACSRETDREELLFHSSSHGSDPPKHTLHQSRKPAYRGTRLPGHQGLPQAGRPGPGWGHRCGGGRRAPPAAVHIPGSSCSHPAPGAPPVDIGVVARDRHTVLGTVEHTPAEMETSLSHGHSKWSVRDPQLAPRSCRHGLEPWRTRDTP